MWCFSYTHDEQIMFFHTIQAYKLLLINESFKINDTKTDLITLKIPPIPSTKVANFNNTKTQNENNQSSVVFPHISRKVSSNSTKLESEKEEKRMTNNRLCSIFVL